LVVLQYTPINAVWGRSIVMFQEQNIFITGGAGFIMSHVAEKLADAGKNLVLFDNLKEHDLSKEMKTLIQRENVTFY
jgi:nucleoside-diphosphate-sugar epimerase